MDNYGLSTKTISLENLGIKNANVRYQLSPDELHDITIEKGQGVGFGAALRCRSQP